MNTNMTLKQAVDYLRYESAKYARERGLTLAMDPMDPYTEEDIKYN